MPWITPEDETDNDEQAEPASQNNQVEKTDLPPTTGDRGTDEQPKLPAVVPNPSRNSVGFIRKHPMIVVALIILIVASTVGITYIQAQDVPANITFTTSTGSTSSTVTPTVTATTTITPFVTTIYLGTSRTITQNATTVQVSSTETDSVIVQTTAVTSTITGPATTITTTVTETSTTTVINPTFTTCCATATTTQVVTTTTTTTL